MGNSNNSIPKPKPQLVKIKLFHYLKFKHVIILKEFLTKFIKNFQSSTEDKNYLVVYKCISSIDKVLTILSQKNLDKEMKETVKTKLNKTMNRLLTFKVAYFDPCDSIIMLYFICICNIQDRNKIKRLIDSANSKSNFDLIFQRFYLVLQLDLITLTNPIQYKRNKNYNFVNYKHPIFEKLKNIFLDPENQDFQELIQFEYPYQHYRQHFPLQLIYLERFMQLLNRLTFHIIVNHDILLTLPFYLENCQKYMEPLIMTYANHLPIVLKDLCRIPNINLNGPNTLYLEYLSDLFACNLFSTANDVAFYINTLYNDGSVHGKLDLLSTLSTSQNNFDFDQKLSSTDLTCLIELAKSDHRICLNYVLSNFTVNVNKATQQDKMNALMYAAMTGNAYILDILLEHNANVNMSDSYIFTPLMFAVNNKHIECVRLLISAGSTLDTPNWNNETLLHIAAKYGFNEIMKILLENGANMEIQNRDENTPFMLAASRGFSSIIITLFEYGANIEAKNQYGTNSLMLTAENGHSACLETLIKIGVNINAKDNYGNTALYYAKSSNQLENLRILQKAIEDSQNI